MAQFCNRQHVFFLFVCQKVNTHTETKCAPFLTDYFLYIYQEEFAYRRRRNTSVFLFFFNFAFHFVNDNKWSIPCLYLHIYVTRGLVEKHTFTIVNFHAVIFQKQSYIGNLSHSGVSYHNLTDSFFFIMNKNR